LTPCIIVFCLLLTPEFSCQCSPVNLFFALGFLLLLPFLVRCHLWLLSAGQAVTPYSVVAEGGGYLQQMGDMANRSDAAAVSKVEDAIVDRSSTSATSTPDPEHERDAGPEAEAEVPEQPQQQKRKGGRKPVSKCCPYALPSMSGPTALTGRHKKIYVTSEERKQRNRQAQAAFRERRTEYIKQLEQTIKHYEETLQNLQQSHRSAADECLMLRYKNSLLERILLEKGTQQRRTVHHKQAPMLTLSLPGIDVQAELHAKTGSPPFGPTRAPPSSSAPTSQPVQRYAIPKFPQNRRSLPPKVDAAARPNAGNLMPSQSPQVQPVAAAAASHLSSPALSAAKSPNFVPQGGTMSPSFGSAAQQNQQLRSQPPPPPLRPHFGAQRATLVTSYPGSTASSASTVGSAMSGGSNYYPSPFQNHYDQLGKLSRFCYVLA